MCIKGKQKERWSEERMRKRFGDIAGMIRKRVEVKLV